MAPGTSHVKRVVRIQYVREYKDSFDFNTNTKPFIIFQYKVMHDRKTQLQKYGDIDLVVALADLVQQHHHDPPQLDHTARAGSPQVILVVYVLQPHSVVPGTTVAACCSSIIGKKSNLRTNTEKVRGYRASRCSLRPESASS